MGRKQERGGIICRFLFCWAHRRGVSFGVGGIITFCVHDLMYTKPTSLLSPPSPIIDRRGCSGRCRHHHHVTGKVVWKTLHYAPNHAKVTLFQWGNRNEYSEPGMYPSFFQGTGRERVFDRSSAHLNLFQLPIRANPRNSNLTSK